MLARVSVTLKSGVLDPQGKAIEGALQSLGIQGIGSIRQGKLFEIELDAHDHTDAQDLLRQACDRLLANTVIENYAIEILEGSAS
ncbi:phosphoribosylformylglycinamidine synthase subunit PurS [Lichenihabitans psoromatis]|uniref:phosphoribosylformylglycinamidine synthase subunit PurS n=1 Tax=Lichenihabitans psoromatis TaxID=2528642 RepID=UPI001036AE32|nr:phosphoribosylformylglycinamidine synthase subunit PurS [Lichenihabitans psoromatis]